MKYQIIYNKLNGEIIEMLSVEVELNKYYINYGEGFYSNISSISIDERLLDFESYRVINNILVKKPLNEIRELKKYGKVLTDEERLNILLQPSSEEVTKAESTLEILSTLQEVGLI